MEIVLGIDPGTRITGWGAVVGQGSRIRPVAHGVIRTDADEAFEHRLRTIHLDVRELIEEVEPAVVAIERTFFHKNARSALMLGEGRAAATLAAALLDVPVHGYAPAAVKKAVTGNGRAAKVQVQGMIRRLLDLDEDPSPADAADGLAVAICHLQRSRIPG